MSQFLPYPRPTSSLWGTPQTTRELIPGVWDVTTASHGGFILSPQRQAAMPGALAIEGGQYEEDVNYTHVLLAFEAEFRSLPDPAMSKLLETARAILRNWHPDAYMAFTGERIKRSEHHIYKTIDAYNANIGKIAVTSAFGDWADWVPAGKTGVIGRVIAGCDSSGFGRYETTEYRALVDKERYSEAQKEGRPITFDAIEAELLREEVAA